MIGCSVVEGCSCKVTLEMFNPSEEDIVLHRNTHITLVHPVKIEIMEQQEEKLVEKEEFCKKGHKKRTPTRRAPAGMRKYPISIYQEKRRNNCPDCCIDIREFFSLKGNT